MTLKHQQLPYAQFVNETTKERIQQILSRDPEIDELWHLYGESLGLPATGESQIDAAKKSFQRRLHDIKKSLCNDTTIQSFLSSPLSDASINLALVFTGKLLADKFAGIDICAVSILVAKIGLLKLCQSDQDDA